MNIIAGKSLNDWINEYPFLGGMLKGEEVFWNNPYYNLSMADQRQTPLSLENIEDAENRLKRFAPYVSKVFPDTRISGGIIESPLIRISAAEHFLTKEFRWQIKGKMLLKCDNHLAISGSIKARGGIYEVLKHAESLAIKHNLITINEDYSSFDSDPFRELFSHYSIAVGSTGNLGLSVGIIGAQLGFKVFVHMSSEAKHWKKALLRQKGVIVIEYESDYSEAVKEGRNQAKLDSNMLFIDDENSTDLLLGYATAASRLKRQLNQHEIIVNTENPLFVYLPCGVGGAPGGITSGL